MKKSVGFSIIEIIVVLVIIGIVASVSAPIISRMMGASYTYSDMSVRLSEGRNALLQMTEDLKNFLSLDPDLSISLNGTTERIEFKDTDGNDWDYRVSDGAITRNDDDLVDDVSSGSLMFYYYDSTGTLTTDPDEIYYIKAAFNITDTDGTNLPFTTLVFIRNKLSSL